MRLSDVPKTLFIYVCMYLFILLSGAAPAAYGSFQARGQIGAIDAGLCHGHSILGSEPSLRPTPQLMAMLDP